MSNKQALILVPAYGRRYENEAEVWQDWFDGKDFKISGGPYCSIRDTEAMVMDFDVCTIFYGEQALNLF